MKQHAGLERIMTATGDLMDKLHQKENEIARLAAENIKLRKQLERLLLQKPSKSCARCGGTGWLEPIEGSDGSYATSRPCSCDSAPRLRW